MDELNAPSSSEKKTKKQFYPYRVFISYSHEDRYLAQEVASVLQDLGLQPIWDKNIHPGTAFADAIKKFITYAHIFMPLVTAHANRRPWVHQETGFAMAHNIPVLPLVLGKLPEAMIAQLQALKVEQTTDQERPGNLKRILETVNFDQLVQMTSHKQLSNYQVTDFSEERSDLMARLARHILENGSYGIVRQRANLSSFSIPDHDVTHEDWKKRDGIYLRSDYYHYLLREERLALEIHARHDPGNDQPGCRLIIHLQSEISGRTDESRQVRLTYLLKFLESMEQRVAIVNSPRARDAHLTIVGDWFMAEARARIAGEGWRQTVFHWHAPTVLHGIQAFDQLFESILKEQNLSEEESRAKVIQEIKDVLAMKDTSGGRVAGRKSDASN